MKRKRDGVKDGDGKSEENEPWYSHTTIKLSGLLGDGTLGRNIGIPNACPQQNGVKVTHEEDIGQLKLLPLEILHEVLAELDLRSLVRFKRVNRRAYEAAKSLPQLRAIETHAADALNGALAIRTAHRISCQTLYRALCASECEECGDFGIYLYMLTCRRVCYVCLGESWKFLPLRISHATYKYGISPKDARSLPSMRSLPGLYSFKKLKLREAMTLVDAAAALEKGVGVNGSVIEMKKTVWERTDAALLDYETKIARWRKKPSSLRPRRPPVDDQWDARYVNPLRFVAAVEVPYLNLRSNKVERGFHCLGCEDYRNPNERDFLRLFSESTFRTHLEQYGEIVASEQRSDLFEHTLKLPTAYK